MSKRSVVSAAFFTLAIAGFIALTASPVAAHKEYKDAFKKMYVKPDSTAANDQALAKAFDTAGCATCHVADKDKKVRNAYGEQLAKFLGEKDKKNKAKIIKALDAVAKLTSDPSKSSAPTFGQKIESGKLPAE